MPLESKTEVCFFFLHSLFSDRYPIGKSQEMARVSQKKLYQDR